MPADLDLFRRMAAADHNLAVVATTRPDGSVHASLVSAGVLDDPVTGEPRVGLVVSGGTRKLDHFRRTRRATVVAQSGWQWAAVDGVVRLAGPDDDLDGFDPGRVGQLLRDVFTAAGGSHDDWDEYDRVMVAERRTAVLVTPARITGSG